MWSDSAQLSTSQVSVVSMENQTYYFSLKTDKKKYTIATKGHWNCMVLMANHQIHVHQVFPLKSHTHLSLCGNYPFPQGADCCCCCSSDSHTDCWDPLEALVHLTDWASLCIHPVVVACLAGWGNFLADLCLVHSESYPACSLVVQAGAAGSYPGGLVESHPAVGLRIYPGHSTVAPVSVFGQYKISLRDQTHSLFQELATVS